jgi:hypothetical protein
MSPAPARPGLVVRRMSERRAAQAQTARAP